MTMQGPEAETYSDQTDAGIASSDPVEASGYESQEMPTARYSGSPGQEARRWREVMSMFNSGSQDSDYFPSRGVHVGGGVHIKPAEDGSVFVLWHGNGNEESQIINHFRSPAQLDIDT